jgi:photosystem II stability/assembly factor-like uncharacterized protein
MTLRYRFIFVLMIAAGVFFWTAIVRQHKPFTETSRSSEEERSGALQALDFWTRSRAYPDNDISPDKYFKAVQYAKAHIKKFSRGTASLNQWEFMGPTNLSGRTISLAINPQDPNTIFAGSASGGLWRSRTGGVAGDWQRITIGYPVLGIGSIAIAPNDSSVMYIGTGEVYRYGGTFGGLVERTTRGSYGYGILKSTDAGTTWTKSLDWTNDQQTGVQSIKINPLNPNTVWAATTNGIYKSTNAGASWEGLGIALMCIDIILQPLDSNNIMFSAGNFGLNPSIFRTTDGGANWEDIKPVSFSGKTLLAAYPPNPNDVYASIGTYISDNVSNIGSIWKTTDFGSNWTQLASVDNSVQGWYSHFIAVHPADSMQVVWAGVGIQKSTDGGSSFFGSGGSYSDHHAFAIDPSSPNILYVANDNGVYRSTDFGTTFSYVSNNFNTGQLYAGFANSATDSLLALVQSQDHIPGYLYQGSSTWNHSIGGDEAGWTAINQSNDNIMYMLSRNGGSVVKTTNRGASWIGSGGLSGFGAWNSPIVIAKSNPAILYVGKDKIFKSTASGSGWTAMNGGALIDGGNPALSLAVSETDPDTVLVGTAPFIGGAHILRSTNGGTSFTDVTGTLPDRYPTDVAIDPANSQRMYAVFSGFGAGHIFRSTNAGGSWTNITGSLPDVPTQAILIDPLNSNYLYVGNDIGVYVSTDGGSNWLSFSEGLPDAVLVSDLSYTPSNRTLRCGTHGNGAYQLKLPTTLPSLALQSPNGGEMLNSGAIQQITWTGDLLNKVKLEYSTNNGGSWSTITDSVDAGLPSYNWSVPSVNTSNALVRVSSVSGPVVTDQSNATFTISFTGTTISVNNVWNMVSLPVISFDPRTTSVFPTAVSHAFAYEGSYVVKETLLNGRGYWIKFNADQDVVLFGDSLTEDTIDVVEGWNLMGAISAPVAVTSIVSMPGGIVTSEFFGYNGNYIIVDSLRPGRGTWVNVSQSGQLVLSASPAASPSNRIRIVPTNELPPPAPSDGSISSSSPLPKTFELFQNYPNPFNPSTVIRYQLPVSGHVTLKVFNTLGEEMTTLVNGVQDAGMKSIQWDASELPSGVYMYRLTAGNYSMAKKLLLVK